MMKKFLLLFYLIGGICKGQTSGSGDYIKILSVTDTLNVGDTITVVFTYSINTISSAHQKVIQTWNNQYGALDTLMYVYIPSGWISNTDGTYILKKKLKNIGVGDSRLYSNATTGNYKSFFIRPPVVAGIQELNNHKIQEKTYYDLLGNKIDIKFNELIIEQIGNYRRKIYITEM